MGVVIISKFRHDQELKPRQLEDGTMVLVDEHFPERVITLNEGVTVWIRSLGLGAIILLGLPQGTDAHEATFREGYFEFREAVIHGRTSLSIDDLVDPDVVVLIKPT